MELASKSWTLRPLFLLSFLLFGLIQGCGGGLNLVTITSISPSSGYHLGQVPITIRGTKFYGTVTVQVGGADCTNVTLVSSTELTCTTSSITTPAVADVSVTSSWAGSRTLSQAFTAFRMVYVTVATNNTVSAFQMHPSTGALTAVGSVATGSVPAMVVVDTTGKYALVSNNSSGSISVYSISPTTGALTPVSGSPFTTTATAPYAMTPLAINKILVAATGPSSIDVYDLDSATGTLSVAAGGVATANSPRLMARNAAGTFAFLHITGSSVVNAYSVSPSTGALTQTDSTAMSGIDVAVDPQTRFAFAADISGNINAYSFDTGTGLFGAPNAVVAPNGSRFIAITPSGTFLYSLAVASTTIDIYSIDSSSGALTFQSSTGITGSSAGGILLMEPTGEHLFTIDGTTGELVILQINSTSGALTTLSRTAITGGDFQSSIGISGRYL